MANQLDIAACNGTSTKPATIIPYMIILNVFIKPSLCCNVFTVIGSSILDQQNC